MEDHKIMENEEWKCPPLGVQKVNWDVAIDTLNKCIGIGIVWDHEGYALVAKSITKFAIMELVVVEALAVLHATKFSHGLELHKIIMKGDAVQIVNVVNATHRKWSIFGQLLEVFA